MGVDVHTDATRAKMRAAWDRRRKALPTFWDHVDADGDCWTWMAGLHGSGYGLHTVAGRTVLAHRWAWEQLVGPIPSGMTIDHLCRNRRCVNPDHLELVSRAVNTLRGHGPSAMNARMTSCLRGHPFDAANTHIRPDGRRRCRACERARGSTRTRAYLETVA